jgi:purine-binding chemotaxis protein CheW
MNVIVTTGHARVSMLVDTVSDVLDLDEETFEQPPSTLRGSARDLILGAYKLDGRLLLELDLDAAIGTTSPSGIDAEVDDR